MTSYDTNNIRGTDTMKTGKHPKVDTVKIQQQIINKYFSRTCLQQVKLQTVSVLPTNK